MRLPLRAWKTTLESLGFYSQEISPPQSNRKSDRIRGAAFELLESRAMLSASSFNSSTGTLSVTLDNSGDTIAVSSILNSGSKYVKVTSNNSGDISPSSVLASSVKFINITGGSGNDTINCSAVVRSDYSTLEQTTIAGNDGNDNIYGSNAAPVYQVGDANLNGGIDGGDISAFSAALVDLSSYQSTTVCLPATCFMFSMSIATAKSITPTISFSYIV